MPVEEQLQRQQQSMTFETQQGEPVFAQEEPQQVQEQLQEHREQLPEQFEQPQIQGIAPAPELVQPVQQRQLNRKERRNLERQQRRQRSEEEHARRQQEEAREKAARQKRKKMAAAKLQMDKLEKKMRKSHIPGDPATDYEAARPKDSYVAKSADLERLILNNVTDEERCRELLGSLREYEQEAAKYDQKRHDMEFRQKCIPLYAEKVEKDGLTESMGQQLAKERVDFFLTGSGYQADQLYHRYEDLILHGMSPQQQQQAKQEVKTGKEQYKQELTNRMEQGNITQEEARKQRAEEIIRRRRPLTLQMLEENRAKLHPQSDIVRHFETNGFCNIKYINTWIQKKYPGEPKVEWEDMDKLVTPYLKEAMTNLSYQMRVPNCRIMDLILDSGRFKTQLETGSSGGTVTEQRAEVTGIFFGEEIIKEKTEEEKKKKEEEKRSFMFGVDRTVGMPAEQYEIYGYGSHGDLVKESKSESNVGQGVGQYGQIVVKLKKDALKGRVTMTLGDSLDSYQIVRPTFVNQPDFLAVSARARYDLGIDAYLHNKKVENGEDDPVDLERALNKAGMGYLELQYHGGLRVEDIESVTLLADYQSKEPGFQPETEMPPELVARLKTLGIRATIVRDGAEHEL